MTDMATAPAVATSETLPILYLIVVAIYRGRPTISLPKFLIGHVDFAMQRAARDHSITVYVNAYIYLSY